MRIENQKTQKLSARFWMNDEEEWEWIHSRSTTFIFDCADNAQDSSAHFCFAWTEKWKVKQLQQYENY